jgi:hypothetical protein
MSQNDLFWQILSWGLSWRVNGGDAARGGIDHALVDG